MTRPLVYSRDLVHAHPLIQGAWPKICEEYRLAWPDRWLRITCTYRSHEVQGALWLQGRANLKTVNEMRLRAQMAPIKEEENRVVTWTRNSRHNVFPSEALDCVVTSDPDGPAGPLKPVLVWDTEAYKSLLVLARKHGLVSGGEFKHQDWPHVEMP